MIYGYRNDLDLEIQLALCHRVDPFSVSPLPALYSKRELNWNDVLYNIQSNFECLPHLAMWGDDNVTHTRGPMPVWVVNQLLAPYLQNLNEDEVALVEPLLAYIDAFGYVNSVQSFKDAVQLSVDICGIRRTLLISVINMMEYENGYDHFIHRESIN